MQLEGSIAGTETAAVVGFAVVGLAVVGLAVVGFAVAAPTFEPASFVETRPGSFAPLAC